jgi:predicted pyridoxine 5'-phosphate oxidase superfamily flavin-nucleotide-binding protein
MHAASPGRKGTTMIDTAQDIVQSWAPGTVDSIKTVEELREVYGAPLDVPAYRHFYELTPAALKLIGSSRLIFLASFNQDGQCDVTPRGGPPGFVRVLDSNTFAIPDMRGNRHIRTLCNIVENGRLGVIFITPGDNLTVRVIGSAIVSASSEARDLFPPPNKPPLSVILVKAEVCFVHCPKAFTHAELWKLAGLQTSPAPRVKHGAMAA